MKRFFSEHWVLVLLLLITGTIFIGFPLRLQALEPYAYASGIEGYFDFSAMFSLAAGEKLPDFGRYHPNHPMGHVLAAVAFDYLHIPALSWMRGINTVATLCTAVLIYVTAKALQMDTFKANLSVGFFLSTHFAALATLSGEWHMPALALNLAGFYRLVFYLREERPRYLYEAGALMALGSCYHINASFILIYSGLMLLFVRPPWRFPKEMSIAALIICVPIFLAYVVIPVLRFNLGSIDQFSKLFLIYSKLNPTPYHGLDWLLISLTGFFHGFWFVTPGMSGLAAAEFIFFAVLALAFYGLARTKILPPVRWLITILPLAWLVGPWLVNSRPDALNGWLFIVPYLSIAIVAGICSVSERLRIPLAIVAFTIFWWNALQWHLPNAVNKSGDLLFANIPRTFDNSTPVAFVMHIPPVTIPEIWQVGSNLGFRNQTIFFPCCGEKNYERSFINWLQNNPKGIIVTDDYFLRLEKIIHSLGLGHQVILDRTANWPASLTPSTVYIPLKGPLKFRKRVVIWAPV